MTGAEASASSSTWSKYCRAANWVLATTSRGVATGAMSNDRSHAASSSSAFDLVAQNAPTMRFKRSYSSIGSRPS